LSGSLARIRGIIHDYKKPHSQASTSTSESSTANIGKIVGGELKLNNVSSAFKGNLEHSSIKNHHHIDPKIFLKDIKKLVLRKIKASVKKHKCIKVNVVLVSEFVRGEKSDIFYNGSGVEQLILTSNFKEWYAEIVEKMLEEISNFQMRDSGWALSSILEFDIYIAKCNSIKSGCWRSLPTVIKNKRAIINVENLDNACFAWAVVSALYPRDDHVNSYLNYPHYSHVLDVTDITFPMTLNQIHKFERKNNLSINVYTSTDESFVYPIYLSKYVKKERKHINIFMIESENEKEYAHFCWIKNFSALVGSAVNKNEHRKVFCNRCIHAFPNNESLKKHKIYCDNQNKCRVDLPSEGKNIFKFNRYKTQLLSPFVVYCDFECMLKNDIPDKNKPVGVYERHEVYSAAYFLHSNVEEIPSRYLVNRRQDENTSAEDISRWLALELLNIAYEFDEVNKVYKKNTKFFFA